MEVDNFWNDRKNSEKVITELNYLKRQLSDIETYKKNIESDIETLELLKTDFDFELFEMLEKQYEDLNLELEQLETSVLLDGTYDHGDAVIEIHSGAGGTEACDWAMMLKRMYTRWCDLKGYKLELVDEQPG